MNLTIKQIEIMKVVVAGATAAAVVDIDQLLERLPYTTSKASLQFSLRAIERHGLIDRSVTEYRRERLRRLIAPTELGHAVIGGTGRPAPGPGAAVVSPDLIPDVAVDEREMSGEAEPLSLPELTFPEPPAFLETLVEEVFED